MIDSRCMIDDTFCLIINQYLVRKLMIARIRWCSTQQYFIYIIKIRMEWCQYTFIYQDAMSLSSKKYKNEIDTNVCHLIDHTYLVQILSHNINSFHQAYVCVRRISSFPSSPWLGRAVFYDTIISLIRSVDFFVPLVNKIV